MTMSEQAIDEIRDVFAKIDDSAVDAAVAMIADANKVVVFGGGREGLQIRGLAMRRQKNDAADAAAICEAVTRPSMRFVPLRSLENQAALMHHRVREMLVAQRTQVLNAVRGHLAEIGVIAAQGPKNARDLAKLITADEATLPWLVRAALTPLVRQLDRLDEEIGLADDAIKAMAKTDERALSLMSIPGIVAGDRIGNCRERAGRLELLRLARVLGLSWVDANTELLRRQGTIGPGLEDGQPLSAQVAGRRRPRRLVPSQGP